MVRLDESQLTYIYNVSSEPQPVIFPMPVKSHLTIFYPYSEVSEVNLTDVTGKYLNITFNKPAADFYTTNLSSLSSGVYFLRMKTSDGKLLTKKIIKAG
ncbi:MAG: T9SS type A sorting domain-containing protein [Bacteroidota bacterium]